MEFRAGAYVAKYLAKSAEARRMPVVNAMTGYGVGVRMREEFGGGSVAGVFLFQDCHGCIDAPWWILSGAMEGSPGYAFAGGAGRP